MLFWGSGFGAICMIERPCGVVMDTKYDSSWGGWCSNEVHGLYGVSLWKYIRRGWKEFSSHTIFEL